MSLAFGIQDAEKIIAEFDLAKHVKHAVISSGRSMRELSGIISENENYISQQIKHKNINIPLLYTLTIWLNVNMFEPFLLMLPEHKRGTRKEKELGEEIARLNKELEDLKKERDIYKEIALKPR